MVWGAHSVSKSRGLQIKIQEWRDRGHCVIDINLKGKSKSYKQFLGVFAEALNDAKLEIPPKIVLEAALDLLRQDLVDAKDKVVSRAFSGGTLLSVFSSWLLGKVPIPKALLVDSLFLASSLLAYLRGKTILPLQRILMLSCTS